MNTHKFNECKPRLGIAHNENYRCVEWCGGNIVFSYSKRGQAMCCHFAADKNSLRLIKPAIEDFCLWATQHYKWCKILVAFVSKPSVGRLITKCNFHQVGFVQGYTIYERC